jgi:hydroxylamine reductase (hybrid-cluster protein)
MSGGVTTTALSSTTDVRQHYCIFCSGYEETTGYGILLWNVPLDEQDKWKELAKKAVSLGVKEVEIQSHFECLDPLELPRTRDLVVYLLQHGVRVKIFTNLLWDPRSRWLLPMRSVQACCTL